MTRPLTATYRVQLNAAFTFARAREIVPYLDELGISHLYCSPILVARRGSRHGYDVVDPTRLNPELGNESEFRDLADALHERGMGLIVDVVPNHMGIGAENPFWDDVLEHGERSRFARWFDIDWDGSNGGGDDGRVVLPLLGDELDQVIERGELALKQSASGQLRLGYFDHSFPLDPTTLPPELQLIELDPGVRQEALAAFAGEQGRSRIRELAESQHYRLCGFKAHAAEINYRHFFDVPDLAALRMEDPEVFAETHALIQRILRDGLIDGLRIDHVDGLSDPEGYLERLNWMGDGRLAVGDNTGALVVAEPILTPIVHRRSRTVDRPVFVEKILATDEELPQSWPVDGTTGYEFLNDAEDLFLHPQGAEDIELFYRRMRRLPQGTSFGDIARVAKRAVLTGPLRGDLDRLAELAEHLAAAAKGPFDRKQLANAIADFIACLPAYRTYLRRTGTVGDADRRVIERALEEVRTHAPESYDAASFLTNLMLGRADEGGMDPRLEFAQRLQQLSGPAAAKGVEDTALYVYLPLVSRNEVGGAPDRTLGNAGDRFHRGNARRAERWPRNLLCTTTHDTKRSADVRSRLDVLSEVPSDWERSVRRWRRLNARHRGTVRGRLAPDTNSEYLLYQTLLAIWPAPRSGRRSDDLPDRAWRESARERLEQYMVKAAREAKLRTSWTTPDAAYEGALRSFVRAILTPSEDAPFLADVARLVSQIAAPGAWNALSRLVLHLSAPGIPDIYQGDELWNFVLVDPDNRRAVDYESRSSVLSSLRDVNVLSVGRVDPFDPRTKLLITHRLLNARRGHPDLFSAGTYTPLTATGLRASHVVAFLRSNDRQHALCIAARLMCDVEESRGFEAWWGDTTLQLPSDVVESDRLWRSVVDERELRVANALPLGRALAQFPGALLVTA
jgi:(1->4)-alpha-D-glucan 1-alpha-D-glucosylmutase